MFSRSTPGKCLYLLAVLTALAPFPSWAADLKLNPKIQPGLPAGNAPSGGDTVGKMINPSWRNGDVPLAAPGVAEQAEPEPGPRGPQIYGRAEQGGQNGSVLEGLLGVRVPFPAASGGSSSNTTSGGSGSGSETSVRTH